MLRTVLPAFTALLMAGCHAEPKAKTVRGPETQRLLAAVDRPLVFEGTHGAIEILEHDQAKSRIVRPLPDPQAKDIPTIHSLSGPDEEGRIAYVEDHFFVANDANRRHALKSVRVDGAGDTEYFSRPGDAMWALSPAGKGEIGTFVALAARGGSVALLSRLEPKQMPEALLHVGRLEIWNLDSRAGRSTSVRALDQPMSWFPDGKRLAYSKLVPRDELAPKSPGIDPFGQYFALQQAGLVTLVMCCVTAMTLDWDSAPARPRLRDRMALAATVLGGWLLPAGFVGCGLMVWLIHAPFWFGLLLLLGIAAGAAVLATLAVGMTYVSEWVLYGLRARFRASR
jgi:hypothetical protein